jgi:hypothetical protein
MRIGRLQFWQSFCAQVRARQFEARLNSIMRKIKVGLRRRAQRAAFDPEIDFSDNELI